MSRLRSCFRVLPALVALAAPLLSARPACAVHLFGTDARNTSAPTGSLANSGWQYAGYYHYNAITNPDGTPGGDFDNSLIWPIAPNWFVAAKHTVDSSAAGLTQWSVNYSGNNYGITEIVNHPTADLSLIHINGTIDSFAPLYTGSDETQESVPLYDANGNIRTDANGNPLTENVGKQMMVYGFGGLTPDLNSPILTQDGRQAGWNWKGGFHYLAWGTNRARSVEYDTRPGSETEYLRFTYEKPTLDNGDPNPHYTGVNEGFGAPEDSSAGIFIQEGGVWKLAGVLYGIDAEYDKDGKLFSDPRYGHDIFWGAIYDARGLYQMQYNEQGQQTGFELITGDNPVPTGDYATRLSTFRPWIGSVTGITAAPEPGTAGLLLSGGLIGLTFRRTRRQKHD